MRQDRHWWSEPVVHFIVVGALLVVVQALAAPGNATRAIRVSDEVVRGLRADFIRRTGALPSRAEEEALVEDHVHNELLYREALALGLDKGDVVVRRRLIQKMQFLLEDEEPLGEPADSELEAYLRVNAARYAAPPLVAVSHVFVSADRHADPQAEALALSREVAAGRAGRELGDPFLRGRDLPLYDETALAGIFGHELAAAAMALPAGEWSGPLRSSYGYHLVLVRERQPGRAAALAEVRGRLLRDWRAEQREDARARAFARLRAAYDVQVEGAGGV